MRLSAAANIASSTKKKVLFNYPGGAGGHVDCAPDSAGNCRNPGGAEEEEGGGLHSLREKRLEAQQ